MKVTGKDGRLNTPKLVFHTFIWKGYARALIYVDQIVGRLAAMEDFGGISVQKIVSICQQMEEY